VAERAAMSQPGGREFLDGLGGPGRDPEAQAFAALWAWDEARWLLARTEPEGVGRVLLSSRRRGWAQAALAEALQVFVGEPDLQTCRDGWPRRRRASSAVRSRGSVGGSEAASLQGEKKMRTMMATAVLALMGTTLAAQTPEVRPQRLPVASSVAIDAPRFQIVNGTPEFTRNIMLLNAKTGEAWVICGDKEASWCPIRFTGLAPATADPAFTLK
jgi:hypothetical protein